MKLKVIVNRNRLLFKVIGPRSALSETHFPEIGEIKEVGAGYTFLGVDVKVRRGLKQV